MHYPVALRIIVALFSLFLWSGIAPVSAQAVTAVVAGTVLDGANAAVPGAIVTATGPATGRAMTDASGSFVLTLAPGLYRIDIRKGGFAPTSIDVTAVAGTSTPLSATLTAETLSSLHTIGRVSSQSRGSQINTGAAVSNYLPAQAFTNLPNPQINDVLEHLPDVTVEQMGDEPDTAIIVGNVQPYETQVLVDGHPLALGQYGVWLSHYYPSFLVGGVETASGPGNTTPFGNIAVGGTANLLTPSFTQRPAASLTFGVDSYQTQYSNVSASGSLGHLQYVGALGTGGNNGPYYQRTECIVNPDNSGANSNSPTQSFGVVQTCTDASGSFFTKGMLGKLKYNFSPSTSFEGDFIGAWGGYNPQGTAWALAQGRQTVEPCLASNPLHCTPAQYAGLIGQTITGYTWYTGSSVYTNQNIFDGEFRTSLGNNTLLIRPYVADIEPEIILGAGQTSYAAYYSPAKTYGNSAATAAFDQDCGNNYDNITNPAGQTVVTPTGQIACFSGAYTTYEQDKLYGSTFSILHPFGDSVVNLTYDFHGQSTYAYIDSPAGVSVPLSTNRYSTFSLTSDVHLFPKVGFNLGLYDTLWTVNGVKPVSTTDASLVGFTRSVSRFDPHVALTFRPNSATSFRAAWGTSATFPFVGQVSGLASFQTPAQSLGPPYQYGGTLTEKNANLSPEVSLAYSVGVDHRFARAGIISVDLTDTIIHNVFETLTTTTTNPNTGGLEGIFSPINVAKLDAKVASIKYDYSPRKGFGFNATAGAASVIASGLPASAYSVGSAGFPVNNVQICGNGISAPGISTCIPYLKGYGQVTWGRTDGSFIGLGINYQGKNNAYYQAPFALADLVARRPVSTTAELQFSIENLFNTNNFGNYLSTPNAGTPVVAGTIDATGKQQQTAYVTSRVSAPPRTVYLQVRLHLGR